MKTAPEPPHCRATEESKQRTGRTGKVGSQSPSSRPRERLQAQRLANHLRVVSSLHGEHLREGDARGLYTGFESLGCPLWGRPLLGLRERAIASLECTRQEGTKFFLPRGKCPGKGALCPSQCL